MRHKELLQNETALQRGDELLMVVQSAFETYKSTDQARYARLNYFEATVGWLIEDAVKKELSDEGYAELGRAVVGAHRAQQQLERSEQAGERRSIWSESFAPLEELLTDLGSRAIAMKSINPYNQPFERLRGLGREHPAKIGGILVPQEIPFSYSDPRLHVSARPGGRVLYQVTPLHPNGSGPAIKVAIGE
jgi:hypothetical protein